MLTFAPDYIPPLQLMLDDLGAPSNLDVAVTLGCTPRTVARWVAHGEAPRAESLGLFWLTRWGQSSVDCAATNDARHYAAMARCYLSEIERLEDEVRRLQHLGDFGCANDTATCTSINPSESLLQTLDYAARGTQLSAVRPR